MSEEAAVMDNPQTAEEPSHLDSIFGGAMPEAPSEEVAEEVVNETEGTTEDVSAPKAEEPEQADNLSLLREQNEQLRQELANLKPVLDRQGNELGELRRLREQMESKAEETKEDPNEFLNKFAEDPVGTQKELLEKELAKREEQSRNASLLRSQARSKVLSIDPDFETKLEDIKGWYQEKGASPDFVSSLTLDQFYSNVDQAVMAGEIVSLKKQLAETQSKNEQVIDKINKGSSVVSGRTGQPTNSTSAFEAPSSSREIAGMSDAELEAALKKLSKSA